MSDNVVTIKGNQYKYTYVDGDTKYLGPVGDAPPLTEEEFLKVIINKRQIKFYTAVAQLYDGSLDKYEEAGERYFIAAKKHVNKKVREVIIFPIRSPEAWEEIDGEEIFLERIDMRQEWGYGDHTEEKPLIFLEFKTTDGREYKTRIKNQKLETQADDFATQLTIWMSDAIKLGGPKTKPSPLELLGSGKDDR